MPDANVVRVHLRVRGIVQGVGFRPHVYSLATELGLTGFVLNDSEGVAIEVEGLVESVQEFGRRLRADPPTLAVIETVDEQAMRAAGAPSFEIRISDGAGESRAPVSPDVATIIENVGNIVCPAEFRVGEDVRAMVASVAEGEDKPLKYPLMFRACELVVVKKVDLLPHLDFDLDRFLGNLQAVHPGVEHLLVSARTGAGIDAFRDWLLRTATAQRAPT